jgi:hypothetical protein
VLLITGCQKGGKQDQEGDKNQATEQQSDQQQAMPGQLGQQGDIEVSDEEIQKFVEAAKQVQSISMGVRQDMNKAVQDEDMGAQRFNEIQRSQQTQQGNANATDAEMEQYQKIMEKIQNLQSSAQGDMEKAIKDAGLTVERYQSIAQAAQQDTTLMKQIQEEMQSSMQMQGQ